ncbi:MAG: CoA-binding protein [Candidatus Zixiibacteriota bacterium]
MNDTIRNFVNSKNIALFGVSSSGKRFGDIAYKTLRDNGYKVMAVHPTIETFEGDKVYSGISMFPDKAEAALICIKPDRAETVMDDIIGSGIKRIWFQQGADFGKSIEKAQSAGMEVVHGKCIMMYAEPVKGIHSFHRWLWKLFRKY